MHTYNADVTYVTRKGNMKRVSFGVTAQNIKDARADAEATVLSNGQRQAVSITDAKVTLVGAPAKRGFLSRLLGLGT